MRKISFLLLGLVLLAIPALAQRAVSGKVTDDKGNPVSNASVVIKGLSLGTVTKPDGTFTLTIPSNAKTLVFSAVDMVAVEESIGEKTVFNVVLKADDRALQEVVVTGYSRERRGTFAGANSVVSGKVIETVPVGSFDQVLQGRSPGLLVNSGTGQPGASANVTIRGVSSISGAFVQPLYVLDGVPIPASDFQTLNPNDFESVTVLRDADAGALYGSRGGLGVIVITTKRGKSGTPSFTYRSQYGFTQPPSPSNFDMMNTKEILAYEEKVGLAGGAINGPGWIYSPKNPTYATASAAEKARRDFLLDSFSKINPDYYDILFRNGFSQSHDLNVQGGTDKTRFFVSAGMFDQKGTDLNARLRRYTLRFNLDQTIGKLNVAFNNSLGFSLTNQNEGDWLGNSIRNPFQIVWRAKPYENPFDANGNPITGPNTGASPKVIGNTVDGIRNSYWQERQTKINSGLTLTYKLTSDITIKNTAGVDLVNEFALRSINANSFTGRQIQPSGSGYHAENSRIRANLINTSSITYSKKFAQDHDLSVAGFFEVVKAYNRGMGFQLYNLDPLLSLTGQGAGTIPTGGAAAVPQNGSSAKSEWGIRSYFGTVRYTFQDKYTIRGSVRRDGTSRIINEDNKNITTWSAGFIWDAGRENFMSNINFITDLKLRGSYGQTPNIGSIPTAGFGLVGGIYGVTNYLGPQLPTFGTSNAWAGSSLSGLVPTGPGNANLKIEFVEKANIGLDIAMWNNRIRLSVDYYRNKTVDLFVNQPLPANSGFGGTSININAGEMTNRGIEAQVSVDVIKNKDWTVTVGGNHSYNRNRIEDLGLVNEFITGTSIIRVGLPYGSHYTIKYLGADPSTGRPTWAKADGSPTINRNEAAQFADFGSWQPKHIGGFTLDVSYKRFSVSALFSYQFDVMRYNNIESWTTRGIAGYANAVNQSRRLITMQWEKPGDQKYYPSPLYDRDFSSADIMDAKFMRLRNLNVSYTIPTAKFGNFTAFKSLRLYVQGQNLLIWSPWRGLDPEDSNNISLNEYPNPRAIVFGVDVNF